MSEARITAALFAGVPASVAFLTTITARRSRHSRHAFGRQIIGQYGIFQLCSGDVEIGQINLGRGLRRAV
jgi:hypothetical protein